MFKLEEIRQEPKGYFSARAMCRSSAEADKLRSGYITPVRQISMFADLYCEGCCLVLEAPDRETLLRIGDTLNHTINSNTL